MVIILLRRIKCEESEWNSQKNIAFKTLQQIIQTILCERNVWIVFTLITCSLSTLSMNVLINIGPNGRAEDKQ